MRGRAVGRPRRPLLLIVGVVYAAVTAVTTLLWWLDLGGWLLLPFDLLAFWWPLPALPLALLAARRRDRPAVSLLLVPVGFWIVVHGGLFLPRGTGPEPTLTVASLNVLASSDSVEQVAALVEAHEPDVLLLEEVFPSRMAALRERLAATHPHARLSESRTVGGVALFSRRPIERVIEVARPHQRARGTFVAIVDGVQYVPVHLTSPCPTCGDSLAARLAGEDAAREAEMRAILEALDPTLPAVVGGDFNSTARGDPYRLLVEAGFRDVHRERGWGPGFTWSTRLPFELLRIDWILARGLEPASATVGPAGISDHRPVIVGFIAE
ncbi:MAG: endonuclease/exonuclease/phosphatase family protein [Nitriliruptorales bacterium]|nr:endonuclease/exonuclease/phosphatase family protein [Nitriliruptorales bacterium]